MRLTYEQRIQVTTLRAEGLSYELLAERFNVRKATIIDLVCKYQKTGSVAKKERTGRPKVSTERQDRALVRMSSANPTMTSSQLHIE